ncbi:MAG: hypothetical protein ACRD2N_04650 [Vicinamibacterales bacterium]
MPMFFGISAFLIVAALFALLGAVFVVGGLGALRRRRPLRFALRTLLGLLLISVGALCGAIGIGLNGYRALTREEVAARVEVRPIAAQRFEATFRMPDQPAMTYEIAGDAIYVDAHVLKWTPMANMLGLHTAYELDRVAGRYDDLTQEQTAERTVHSLALIADKRVDLYGLRRRYAFLAPLFDAEYGSGSFVPVTRPATFEVRVSTTGLLIREAAPESRP